jgi:nitroreductase
MNVKVKQDIFHTRRSIRRFKQDFISDSILCGCVNAARLGPSGRNIQPIEYIVVTDDNIRKKLFTSLHWAGYLKPSWKPGEDERPMAYIVLIIEKNTSSTYPYDVGIALGHIVLYAEYQNIGSCILQNIDKSNVQALLDIPRTFEIEAVVALGYKKQQPILETSETNKKYYLDDDKVLHVPKRPFHMILHRQRYP